MFESFIVMHEWQPSAVSSNRQIVHRTAEKKGNWIVGSELNWIAFFLFFLFFLKQQLDREAYFIFHFFGASDWGIITPFQKLNQLITTVLNMVWPCWINCAPIVILGQNSEEHHCCIASKWKKNDLEHKEICPLTMIWGNTQTFHVSIGGARDRQNGIRCEDFMYWRWASLRCPLLQWFWQTATSIPCYYYYSMTHRNKQKVTYWSLHY